jgi:crotonobetainyl-CoA:carnitine CoA-transferase CaiB-like acyl-CoA transferase
VIACDFIVDLEHPVAGRVHSLGFPPHLRAGAISYRLAPPTLGQHTDQILTELGFTSNDILRLREGKIV